MQVRELMTPQTSVLKPKTSVQDAARMMRQLRVDLLPVGTDKGLIGVLAGRDIAVRITAEGLDAKDTPVQSVMNLGLPSCYEDQDVREAIDILRSKGTNSLLVLDRDRRPVGVFRCGAAISRSGPLPRH